MASYLPYSFLLLATLIHSTYAQNGLILPVRKDAATSQFYTTIQMGSNRVTINAVLDLGSPSLWFACNNYTSTTYAPVPCDSQRCQQAEGLGCISCNLAPRPGCTNNTCGASPYNPFQDVFVSDGYAEDKLSLRNDNVGISQFLFSCMDSSYIEGLARGATGMLGLSRNTVSIHRQVATKHNVPDAFTLCFPSSGVGKLSIGRALVSAKSNITLKSTALITNPSRSIPMNPSEEYFINVTSITVAGQPLSLKDSYFTIDANGVGGTKISTVQNYTSLHNSIYKPFTRAFVKAASDMGIKSMAAVAPFRACFRADSISRSGAGPNVPEINLVMPGTGVYWRIGGANAVVEVDRETTCLAFVDGGSRPTTSIVIGVHQLEENLLEFDLVSSQLKFSSSLLLQNKRCSNL